MMGESNFSCLVNVGFQTHWCLIDNFLHHPNRNIGLKNIKNCLVFFASI